MGVAGVEQSQLMGYKHSNKDTSALHEMAAPKLMFMGYSFAFKTC